MKHPWEAKEKYYVYNLHEKIVGGPQRVISESDRNRLICPHCPRSLLCLTRAYVGKDLNIVKSSCTDEFIVRCSGYDEKEHEVASWNGLPSLTQFYIPLDYFEGLP